jgi:tetratricopeptide (TPR) repeat protein
MRRQNFLPFLLSISVLLTLLPVSAADNSQFGDKWALVIGISKFVDPGINLKYADKDAKDFRDFLVNKANFAADHVKLLLNENATRADILDYLGDKFLPHVAMQNDLVVIFISSHGSPSHADVAGANFLVANDTQPEHLFATGISMQELASIIKQRVHANRVVIFLDACHSGAALTSEKGILRKSNFDAQDVMQGTGQFVVCSSEPGESSWESKNYDNGVFTKHLLAALASNGEKTTLTSAFDSLKESVQREVLNDRGVLQTPVLASKWSGNDLTLMARPNNPRPAPSLQLASVPKRVPTEQKAIPPDVTSLKELAARKMRSGQYAVALGLYESLRAVLESTLGRDTPETAECLTQLGWLYAVQGRLLDAESLQRESVRINETIYGANSFFVAREVTLLCNTLISERKYAEADPVAMRAVAAWQGLGGIDNPNVLESLVNLGVIRQHQKQYQEAQQLFDHASRLATAQKLTPDNPQRIKLDQNFESLRSVMSSGRDRSK